MASKESVEEMLTCSLCFDMFDNKEKLPKLLPCSHTFCAECLGRFVMEKMDVKIPCPLCQAVFTVPKDGVKSLPTNIMAKQLMETIPVPKLPIKGKPPKGQCLVHKKEGSFICKTCYVPLCNDCMINLGKGPHVNHELDNIDDAVEQMHQEIHNVSDKVQKMNQESDDIYLRFGNDIERNETKYLTAIKEKATRAHADVDKWATALEDKVRSSARKDKEGVHKDQRRFSSEIEKIQAQMSDATSCINDGRLERGGRLMSDVKKMVDELTSKRVQWKSVDLGSISENKTLMLGDFTHRPLILADELEITNKLPSVDEHTSIKLGSKVPWRVGLSNEGIIIADDKLLTKYNFKGTKMVQEAQIPLPAGINQYCHKHLLDDGRVVLHDSEGNPPTFLYTHKLHLLKTFQGKFGRLISTLSNDVLAYHLDGKVTLYNIDEDHRAILVLVPKEKYGDGDNISVTRHPTTGYMAVANLKCLCLDIYDGDGTQKQHVSISLKCSDISNFSSSTSRHIFIIQYQVPAIVSVHNWHGQHLGIISHDQLKLSPRDYLYTSMIKAAEDKLFLAVGDNATVSSVTTMNIVI